MKDPRERVKTLVYVLLRDHLPLGTVDQVIAGSIRHVNAGPFSDKNLEALADRVTNELLQENTDGR